MCCVSLGSCSETSGPTSLVLKGADGWVGAGLTPFDPPSAQDANSVTPGTCSLSTDKLS